MSKFRTLTVFTLASMGVLILTSAALAAPAMATTNVNVRSGPGTTFSILDSLQQGENVNAVECVDSGWCRVEHNGPSGWVSSRYLAAPNQGQAAAPAAQPASQNGACFYTEQNFGGREYCSGAKTFNDLGTFNDTIRSYKVFQGAHVNFCVDANMGGACYEGSRSTPTLGGPLDQQASSLSVFYPDGDQNNGSGFGVPAQNNQQPPAQAPAPQNQQSPPVANNQNNGNPEDPNCSFGLVLGPDGPTFSLTCGDNPILPPVAQGNGNAGNNNQGDAGNNNAGNADNANNNVGNNGGGVIAAPAPGPDVDIGDLNIIGEQAPPLPPQNGGANLDFGNQNGAQIPNLPPQNGFGAADQGGANQVNPRDEFPDDVRIGLNLLPEHDGACFYIEENYRGLGFCGFKDTYGQLNAAFFDQIKSIQIGVVAQVKACEHPALQGRCETYNQSVRVLPQSMYNKISSVSLGLQ